MSRLRVGVHAGSQSLFLLRHLGPAPTEIEWHEGTPNELLVALAKGELDISGGGSLPPLRAMAAGQDLCWLACSPPRPGFFAVLTPHHSPIRHFSDLAGHRLAIAAGSWHLHFLVLALESLGLELNDLQLLESRGGLTATLSGQADAWIASGAGLFAAREGGGWRELELPAQLSEQGLWHGNRSFIYARRQLLHQQPETVSGLLQQLQRHCVWIAEHLPAAAECMALLHPGKHSPQRWLQALQALPWAMETIGPELCRELQSGADALFRQGVLANPIDIGTTLPGLPLP